jgi:hypothetical protein
MTGNLQFDPSVLVHHVIRVRKYLSSYGEHVDNGGQ